LVSDFEAGNGGRVAAHGFVLFECHRLDDASDEAADQHARRMPVAESELHADDAVRHGLRGHHLAPEAQAVRAQLRETVFQFLNGLGLPEVLHEKNLSEKGDSR
jgi:hypothetical protein